MTRVVSVVVVLVSSLLSVALLTNGRYGWWGIAAVVILVGVANGFDLDPAARNAIAVATAVVLFIPLEGWANTGTAAMAVRLFSTYPVAYVSATATVLLCLALREVNSAMSLRPATAIMLASTAVLLYPLGTLRDVMVMAGVFVIVPALAYATANMRPIAKFMYAAVEPMIVGAIVWAIVPTFRNGNFIMSFSAYEFVAAVVPVGAMIAAIGITSLVRQRVQQA